MENTCASCSPSLTDEQVEQILAALNRIATVIKELVEAMVVVLAPAFEAIARAIARAIVQFMRLLILSCRREDFYLWLYDRAPPFMRRWMLRNVVVDRLLCKLPAWVVMRLPSDGGTRCH